MKIIVLGCGSSLGCPVLACDCQVCISKNSYNKRTRSAILIKSEAKNILVDFGPDIKMQLIKNKVNHLDSVICTHDHADHTAGLDELRVYGFKSGKALKLYSDNATLKTLKAKYHYLFTVYEGICPYLKARKIGKYENINISDADFQFFDQLHGIDSSLGFRINNFVYSNDMTDFPEKSKKYLENIDTWLIDCIDLKRTHAHAGLDDILEWNELYKPRKIYLTDMGHNLDYNELKRILPDNIQPAYDGLEIDI